MPEKISDQRLQWRMFLVDRISRVVETFARFGFLALIVYFIMSRIELLAGRKTLADIGIRLLANVAVNNALAWGAGSAGILYGVGQRRLRRRETRRLGREKRELEKLIDPGRTTSHLEAQGAPEAYWEHRP